MANFDTTSARRESVRLANNVLALVQDVYQSCKQVQGMLALYQAASDPAFNAAMGALFTSAERAEIAAMAAQINALVTDWEASHRGAIGLTP